uniref:Uncharacterized protein LOC104246299 n=1 Tax=Nicotiana sylvestris TaxID=4096 RepID=A0A1U7Y8E3_NICSY
DEAHSSRYSIHLGSTKIYRDQRQHYWWQRINKDIVEYVARCLNFQQVKYEHQRPGGLLQQMTIPEWKWECITMDFVVGLPWTLRKIDAVWVILDRLTKSAHFIPVATTYTSERLAQIYIREIVWIHGMLVSVILDRGPQFTSHFWRVVQSELGTRVELSTAFHPDRRAFRADSSDIGEHAQGRFEHGEAKLYGTNLVKDALEKLKREGSLEHLTTEGYYEIREEGQAEPQLDESLGYEDEPIANVARQDFQLRSKRIFADLRLVHLVTRPTRILDIGSRFHALYLYTAHVNMTSKCLDLYLVATPPRVTGTSKRGTCIALWVLALSLVFEHCHVPLGTRKKRNRKDMFDKKTLQECDCLPMKLGSTSNSFIT